MLEPQFDPVRTTTGTQHDGIDPPAQGFKDYCCGRRRKASPVPWDGGTGSPDSMSSGNSDDLSAADDEIGQPPPEPLVSASISGDGGNVDGAGSNGGDAGSAGNSAYAASRPYAPSPAMQLERLISMDSVSLVDEGEDRICTYRGDRRCSCSMALAGHS